MANRVLDLLRGKTPDRSAEGVYGIDFDVEFFDYARCGFFPFAWSDWGQPYTRTHAYYKLQAMPVQPLKINDLSLGTDLLNWLSEFRFAVTFRPDWRIDVQELARAAKGRLVGSLRPN